MSGQGPNDQQHLATPERSVFETAVNIIAAPREAFGSIKAKPKVLFPLLVVLVANTALMFAYYTHVDLAWAMETNMEAALEDMNPRQREAATARVGNLTPVFVASAASASSAVFMALWFLLNAAYLSGVSQVTGDGFRLKQWYSLICWSAVPIMFGHAAAVANIFLSDATFLRPDRMNPLSFSSLLNLESAAGSTSRQSLQALDLSAIWTIALHIYGYHAWTERSLFKSGSIVLAPAVLIFGSIFYFTSS